MRRSRNFAAKFGYPAETSRGTFTYGGTEANLSALLMAITTKFPDFIDGGLRSLSKQPLLYVSSESHHSFLKAARMIGLGRSGVREIPVDQNLRMDIAVLERTIARDKQEGAEPFFIVGTVGTTKSGVIDDLQTISSVAARHDLWFHVDAAWGGAIAIVPEYRYLLDGIEKSDSITFDPHKWLSVPLSAGLILTRHADALQRAFRIPADYLPWSPETDGGDPYTHSLEWSRRFTGLKVFLSLWTIGWEGFADVIRHQIKLGQSLRLSLTAAGWLILNETPLPTVCFTQPNCRGNRPFAEGMVREILQSGRAWISVAHLSRPGGGKEFLLYRILHFQIRISILTMAMLYNVWDQNYKLE